MKNFVKITLTGSLLLFSTMSLAESHLNPSVSHYKQHKKKLTPLHQCSIYDNTVDSLACTMYEEARGDGPLAMLLVGETVLNRTRNDNFPDHVKSVIFQPYQFSYNNRRKGDKKIVVRKVYEQKSWKDAVMISKFLLNKDDTKMGFNDLLDLSKGSLYYMRKGEKAKWTKTHHKLFTYKGHVFYK